MVDDRDNGDTRDDARVAGEGDAAATSDPNLMMERETDPADQEPRESQDGPRDLAGADASGQAEDPYEGAVPPGYDWPTHGGYLGCLMGVVAATFVALLVTAPVLYFADLPLAAVWLLRVLIFVACIIGGGRLGWALGKRFYREYPHERPTWGEDDDAEVEGVEMVEDQPGETNARR